MQNSVVNFKTEDKVKKSIPRKAQKKKSQIVGGKIGKMRDETPSKWLIEEV